jgi:hypothetical protein
MSPSRLSRIATLFGVIVATVGAFAIQTYEVSQAQAPVIVQLERVEIIGQRETVVALTQVRATR